MRFPRRLIVLALLSTFALVHAMAWHASTAYRLSKSLREDYLQIEELRGVIVHLDEVLTMSARMGAATADPRWEQRYLSRVPELDAAIEEAYRITAPLVGPDDLDATDAANRTLVAMEQDAFELVREGRAEQAQRLLTSFKYEERKRRYSQGIQRALDSVRADLDAAIAQDRREASVAVGTTGVALTLLLATWGFAVRSLLRWRRALADSVDARRADEERFASLVQNSSDVITVVDLRGRVQYQSPAVERLFGYPHDNLNGLVLLDIVHPQDVPIVKGAMAQLASRPGSEVVYEARVRHRDGSLRTVETTAKSLVGDPRVRGLVLNSRDVTERKALQEELEHLAFHDPLTGLANRALFADRVAWSARRPGPIAVLFCDIDDFKKVNDSLGHASGDDLLVEVARRLGEAVGTTDTTARLGGDEFAVLLEDLRQEADAVLSAERLLACFAGPFDVSGRAMTVRASIGIAIRAANATVEGNELLRNADLAMYMAKGGGGGIYRLFEQEMYTAMLHRLELEADLRRAVERGEFVLHYQPTVSLSTGRISGFEALVRWRHPSRGLVPPGDFIPVAEETGLIVPLGRWVLREACRQAHAWHLRFGADHPITLSVNLSARQMLDEALVDDVRTALADTGFDPAALVVEITETTLMADSEASAAKLDELKRLGAQLAIDDFGTGYSSLSYLRRFPSTC